MEKNRFLTQKGEVELDKQVLLTFGRLRVSPAMLYMLGANID
jgi:hypothetical protein